MSPPVTGASALARMRSLYNPVVIRLLHSPPYGLISGSAMLITCTGRGSGKEYTKPINYVRDKDELLAVGSREHPWWRNLLGGARVMLRGRGRDVKGIGEASP